MPNCTNCGKEITESQYNSFQGMCPDCIRIKKTLDRGKATKAKNAAAINAGIAFVATIVIIALGAVIVGAPEGRIHPVAYVALIIIILVAIANWVAFFVNLKKRKR